MERLKLLREIKQVSQQEIANYLGVTRQSYSNYETGNRQPDFKALSKLSEYFGVSTDYLLGLTDGSEDEMAISLTDIMKFFGWSCADMASYLKRSPSTVEYWESASKTPDAESLKKIADKLNVSVDSLMGRDPQHMIRINDDGSLYVYSKSNLSTTLSVKLDENGNVVYTDENSSNKNNENITDEEQDIIKKYRALDQRGKDAVIETLIREYSYVAADAAKQTSTTA